jgi:hypothetical protein
MTTAPAAGSCRRGQPSAARRSNVGRTASLAMTGLFAKPAGMPGPVICQAAGTGDGLRSSRSRPSRLGPFGLNAISNRIGELQVTAAGAERPAADLVLVYKD